MHAVVARSTFRSQHVKSTPLSHHFWKLRSRNSAPRCGAKHMRKSKVFKGVNNRRSRTTFGRWDVYKVHASVARSIFASQKISKTDSLGLLLDVQHSCFVATTTTTITIQLQLNNATLQLQLQVQLQLQLQLHYSNCKYSYSWNFKALHYTYNDNYTTLHYTTPEIYR